MYVLRTLLSRLSEKRSLILFSSSTLFCPFLLGYWRTRAMETRTVFATYTYLLYSGEPFGGRRGTPHIFVSLHRLFPLPPGVGHLCTHGVVNRLGDVFPHNRQHLVPSPCSSLPVLLPEDPMHLEISHSRVLMDTYLPRYLGRYSMKIH